VLEDAAADDWTVVVALGACLYLGRWKALTSTTLLPRMNLKMNENK